MYRAERFSEQFYNFSNKNYFIPTNILDMRYFLLDSR